MADIAVTELSKGLRDAIAQLDTSEKLESVGIVTRVGDGVAWVHGLTNAGYSEVLEIETNDGVVEAFALNLMEDEIGAVLLGSDQGVSAGDKVKLKGEVLSVPVGPELLGRVVNPLGEPLDGGPAINAKQRGSVEREAIGVMGRKHVHEPMMTGIVAIDAMFPIGRGQRELIIGDRQTGKTAIAIDTMINQVREKTGVVNIYVAIGQKLSKIAGLVERLKQEGVMDQTIIVATGPSDPASLLYLAPYAGTALAEYFMYQGKDVLIVYDDLSKHAVAYRALSLLLERSPGREAYPGDVFYLHSRLLERSSKLSDALGGGSITALPIIETQAGDVSAYIPTNVISITDGQIFLESDLFFSGMRPAVNVGLSVSRVGGAAQTKAMKKASGTIRIDLAQYREMEVFTQFSSDLDDTTKEQLQYGKGLMELLKQPLCHPMSLADQVITLVAANKRLLLDVETAKTKEFQLGMLDFFHTEHMEIVNELNEKKVLDDTITEQIVEAVKEYKSR